MEEAAKEPITEDGQKVLVEVVDNEMKMTLSATPYELLTVINSIALNVSESTGIAIEEVYETLTRFNKEGK